MQRATMHWLHQKNYLNSVQIGRLLMNWYLMMKNGDSSFSRSSEVYRNNCELNRSWKQHEIGLKKNLSKSELFP